MKVLVVILVAMLGAARADDRAAAEKYFRAGEKAYSAQSFSTAAAEFEQAYAALALPQIAFSAAQAYRRAYRVEAKAQYVRRAVELYKLYLGQVKVGGRVGDAADNLGEMERELDRLKLNGAALSDKSQPARTQLGVSVNVSEQASATTTLHEIGDAPREAIKGLVITVDGKPIEPFALIETEPREHAIAVRADGYFPVDKQALAVAGQASLVEVELRPQPGTLAVHTDAGARLAIDGRAVATSASGGVELAPGKHLLTITRDGREPLGRELVIGRGQQLVVEAPLVKTGRRRAVPYLVGGAGVLLAGALTTGVLAAVYDSRASGVLDQIHAGNRPPGDADRYASDVSSRDHFATATWALGGAALAMAGVAGALYLFDHPDAEAIRFSPVVSGSGAGAMVVGHF
jgi:hypothetical protein